MSLTYSRIVTAAGVIAALAIATPAFAGQGRARGRNQEQSSQQPKQPEGRARSREEARPPAPAVRPSPPPQASVSPRQRESSRDRTPVPPPSFPQRERESARVQAPAPQPQVQSRGTVQGHAIPRPSPRVDANPPAHQNRPVIVAPRPVVIAPRYVVVAPRPAWGYYHRSYIAPFHVVRYYQPYYVFQPRARFSFGLSIGYPVAYPLWYDPYPVYGYAIGPRYGGISFDIDPTDAAVFIDGEYVGCVDDFSPYDAPLTLPAGFHRVELRARGWQPMNFDITIAAGQVIPYRGALGYVR